MNSAAQLVPELIRRTNENAANAELIATGLAASNSWTPFILSHAMARRVIGLLCPLNGDMRMASQPIAAGIGGMNAAICPPHSAREWASHAAPASAVQGMRVDHRRLHVRVAEQFLDRSNVVSILQQMRRKPNAVKNGS